MITVTSLLWIWKGSEAAGRWYFITVPEEHSDEIRAHAFGSPRGFRSVTLPERPHRLGLPSIFEDHWEPVIRACALILTGLPRTTASRSSAFPRRVAPCS